MKHADLSTLKIEADDPIGETAQYLIGALCAEMATRYGSPPRPFSRSEAAAPRTAFLVARLEGEAVGCGALRPLDEKVAEIKRMYVVPAARGNGIAKQILAVLERSAQELNYRTLRLETGVRQPEAQLLYRSMGFHPIVPFGPYIGNPTSVCFEKSISQGGATLL